MIDRDDIAGYLIEDAAAISPGTVCSVCGSPISYGYSPSLGAFSVECECTTERFVKMFYEPDCVRLYGAESVV